MPKQVLFSDEGAGPPCSAESTSWRRGQGDPGAVGAERGAREVVRRRPSPRTG